MAMAKAGDLKTPRFGKVPKNGFLRLEYLMSQIHSV